MINIHIHASLTRFTDKQSIVSLPVDTIGKLIPTLCQHYPQLKDCILTDCGMLTPYVNCYINGENLNTIAPHTSLAPDANIELIAALVGG